MTNQSTYRPGLHRYALAVAVCTWLLLLAGALVTSNDAGLAVPDWPLSYGKLMPPMVGGILYEHGHRLIAASVGLLTILLAAWLWQSEPRRWLRRLGLLALALVILQGLLGGITVLFFLPPAISVAHACLAQLFFCTVIAIATATSREWIAVEPTEEFYEILPMLTGEIEAFERDEKGGWPPALRRARQGDGDGCRKAVRLGLSRTANYRDNIGRCPHRRFSALRRAPLQKAPSR